MTIGHPTLNLGHGERALRLAAHVDVEGLRAGQRRRTGGSGRCSGLLHLTGHLIGHRQAHTHTHHVAHGSATARVTGRGQHGVGLLGLLIPVEVANIAEEAAFLHTPGHASGHGLCDLLRQGDVHGDRRDGQAKFVVHPLGHEVTELVGQLHLATLEVDHAELGL